MSSRVSPSVYDINSLAYLTNIITFLGIIRSIGIRIILIIVWVRNTGVHIVTNTREI